jgi:methylenetetrahydrofolate dehydrogenase (NADP+)/methenyltetrahydrofolate cyclohydrolase
MRIFAQPSQQSFTTMNQLRGLVIHMQYRYTARSFSAWPRCPGAPSDETIFHIMLKSFRGSQQFFIPINFSDAIIRDSEPEDHCAAPKCWHEGHYQPFTSRYLQRRLAASDSTTCSGDNMVAKVIDGKALANQVRQECHRRAQELAARGCPPGLAVILVGDDSASGVYVQNKIRACTEVGLHSEVYRFAVDTPEAVVLAAIERLNVDDTIHGILVQLPLPPQFQLRKVLEAISPEKDVDGFHLYNVGGLVMGDTVFPPCTPYGVRRLLESENISVQGQNVVVVGASNIVGKPMALMLMQQEATVAICHAKTRDLAQFTILADILVVAAGKPNLIVAQMVKTGAVVIDVGINRLADGSLAGDVDFEGVRQKASYITAVPGGVGPMTVTMLMHNTVQSAERFLKRQQETGDTRRSQRQRCATER